MVPTQIRTNLFEMAVILAATTWHVTHSMTTPRHAEPIDEAERDRDAEQAADRLHQAVAALQAEYARMFPTAERTATS